MVVCLLIPIWLFVRLTDFGFRMTFWIVIVIKKDEARKGQLCGITFKSVDKKESKMSATSVLLQ